MLKEEDLSTIKSKNKSPTKPEVDLRLFGWLGLVGRFSSHLNHCSLFTAKFSLYMYNKYIWFCLVGFYGVSIIAGYLMPNPLYTYVIDIYDFVLFCFMAYQPLLVI